MKLITGGAGVTATQLAKELLMLGEKIRLFDNRPTKIARNESTEFVEGDLRDSKAVYEACRGVDTVFHLGAVQIAGSGQMVPRISRKIFYQVNVEGTRNVLDASLKQKVAKVIYLSSSIIYGVPKKVPCDEGCPPHPIGEYGKSKWEAERLCQEYFGKGLDITIFRPRTIVGPGRLGLFWILFDWIRRGKRIYLIGPGNNRFQFVSISDTVQACILALRKGSGETFNLGSEDVAPVRKEIEALIKYARTSSPVTPINATLVKFLLKMGKLFSASPLVEEHYLVADKNFVLDISKARKILGWKPQYTNLQCLTTAYDWYIQNYKNIPPEYQGILKILRYFS